MSDVPNEEPLKRYMVSLSQNVAAASPREAIEAYIKQLNTFGLTVWHYTVMEEGGEPLTMRLHDSEKDERDELVDESTPESSD